MQERSGIVTLGGKPVTLLGPELKPGDDAPDVELTDSDLKPFKLSTLKGKVTVLTTLLSLDTSVCDAEVHKFNQQVTQLGDKVEVITISKDTPFTMKRWCGNAGIDRVKTMSDYRDGAFGKSYGTMMKGIDLHARAVFVVNKDGDIVYKEIVPEVGHEPNYDGALSAVRKALGN